MFESDALFELRQDPADALGFADLAQLPLVELMAPDWAAALAGVEGKLRAVLDFLAAEEAAGHPLLPPPSNVLRAFRQPLARVKVLIVGQDPSPTPGHPIGFAYAVERAVRPIPRSLQTIYREMHDDLVIPSRSSSVARHRVEESLICWFGRRACTKIPSRANLRFAWSG